MVGHPYSLTMSWAFLRPQQAFKSFDTILYFIFIFFYTNVFELILIACVFLTATSRGLIRGQETMWCRPSSRSLFFKLWLVRRFTFGRSVTPCGGINHTRSSAQVRCDGSCRKPKWTQCMWRSCEP